MKTNSWMVSAGSLLFKAIFWLLFFVYVCIPILLYIFPSILTKFIFFTIYADPFYKNFSDFSQFGRSHLSVRNFYIPSFEDSSINLGMWHVLPNSDVFDESHLSVDPKEFEKKLSNGRPIILYLHGNSFSRGGLDSNKMYNVLTALEYHVIAVDYRGFGDSNGVPWFEEDVVNDALAAYKYASELAPTSSIYFWGHSLGSAIGTGVCCRLRNSSIALSTPNGIFLESPFDTLKSATKVNPKVAYFTWSPFHMAVIMNALDKTLLKFNNTQNLEDCNIPVSILHAKDDHIIPYELALKLYNATKASRENIRFHSFPENKGYLHKCLHKAPELPHLIRKFVDDTQ